jgi:hypothetical protein
VPSTDLSASAAKSCFFRLRSLSLTGAPVASWIAWRKTHNFMSNILSFKSCDLFLCEIDIERSNPIFQVFHFCCSNNRSYDSRFCSHPGSGDLPHGYAASIRNRLHGIYNAFIGFLGWRRGKSPNWNRWSAAMKILGSDEICRKISQNFSPAGVTSPFVARAIPMAAAPTSCRSAGERAGVCQPHLGPVYLRVSAACLPNFFKSRSNVSRSFFERTLATSSIAAACSPNPRLISARPLGVSSTLRTRRSSG